MVKLKYPSGSPFPPHTRFNCHFFIEVQAAASLFRSPGTLLSILANLNSDVICMCKFKQCCDLHFLLWSPVSLSPILTSGSHSKNSKCNLYHRNLYVPLFFSLMVTSKYLFLFSFSFILTAWSTGTAKCTRWQIVFFLFIKHTFRFLVEIWWSVCVSKFKRILCILFFRLDFDLYIY